MDIERALQRLPVHQAQAIRLFYLDDLSTREIAERMGRPKGTITGWLHRARQHLAVELEAYTAMKSTEQEPAQPAAPSRSAALVHTDLEPGLVQQIADALRTRDYGTEVLTPSDPDRLVEALGEYQLILLDEQLGGHSAFEFLMHIRSREETKMTPVWLLRSTPSRFSASAYFLAGVNRLVDKRDPDVLTRSSYSWRHFTERARRIVGRAKKEAERLGENSVGTEHLLLGMVRETEEGGESVAARILGRLGVPLDRIRDEIEGQVTPGPGYDDNRDMQLSPAARCALHLGYEEAWQLWNSYFGTEHILLGLIREEGSLAGQVLRELGADLERARQEIRALQSQLPDTQ
jgi:CheY-like chemotaxis protein